MSSYDDIYVLEYNTHQEAKKAVKKLKTGGAEYAEEESAMHIADNSDTQNETPDADSVDEALNTANKEETIPDYSGQNVIALIDTGTDNKDNVIDSKSFVDDDGIDRNGHGTKMLEAIKKQDQDAKVISLKALDDNGNGSTASVIAALQYAIDTHVNIINMSFSGEVDENNKAIETKVNEAVDSGITAVGAAGNNSSDAKDYIPGKIEKAVIVGAVQEDATLQELSNYGDTVDCYVTAKTTSESTAIVSGILSEKGKLETDNKTIWSTTSRTCISDGTDLEYENLTSMMLI